MRQATGLLKGSIPVPGLRTLALVSKWTCPLRVKTVKNQRIQEKLHFMQSRSGLSNGEIVSPLDGQEDDEGSMSHFEEFRQTRVKMRSRSQRVHFWRPLA